jgi:hypothetical protein
MSKRLVVFSILEVLLMLGTVSAQVRPGFDTAFLPPNDDASTDAVPLGFNLNFFGDTYSNIYVNNNGNATFSTPLEEWTPFGLTTNIGTAIMAPFFADVDTRAPGSGVVTYGTGTVNGFAAFGVTWNDVGYYDQHDDKLNDFQLVLIDRPDRNPGDFDMEFNYDQIQWETGDASGGIDGFGGESAVVGYSNGTGDPGTFFQFPGSGVNGYFLDSSSTGLVNNSLNSDVLGRYAFTVVNGEPGPPTPPPGVIPAPGALLLAGIGASLIGCLRRRRTL